MKRGIYLLVLLLFAANAYAASTTVYVLRSDVPEIEEKGGISLGDIRDWITLAGIVGGYIWGIWKYGYAEKLRNKKEMPAITSKLNAEVSRVGDGCAFLVLTSQWKNHCPMPIRIDPKKVQIDVHRIAADLDCGFVTVPEGFGAPAYRSNPFAAYREFVLEPSTDSSFNAYVTVPSEGQYLVRWSIVQAGTRDPYTWDAEAYVDPRAPASPKNDENRDR